MSEQSRGLAALNEIVRNYEQQGYTVFVAPSGTVLPAFMQGYHPDAIALKPGANVAIEVSGGQGATYRKKIDHLNELFQDRDDWSLSVFYTPATPAGEGVPIVSSDLIKAYVEKARELSRMGENEAALLVLWAAFEATARLLSRSDFSKPQSPGRIVQVLSERGTLTVVDEGSLRGLVNKRNAMIHGDLGQRVGADEILGFANIIDRLLDSLWSTRDHSASSQ